MNQERKEAVVWAVEQLLDAAERAVLSPSVAEALDNLDALNTALARFGRGRGTLEVPTVPE